MPMDKERYPKNWKKIAFDKKQSVDWKCEVCGMQCRRPGETFDTHKRTLTVAHLNHTPEDCRPENLKAMCAGCHLRYDAKHHAETRKRKSGCASCRWFIPEEGYCIECDVYCHGENGGNCDYWQEGRNEKQGV